MRGLGARVPVPLLLLVHDALLGRGVQRHRGRAGSHDAGLHGILARRVRVPRAAPVPRRCSARACRARRGCGASPPLMGLGGTTLSLAGLAEGTSRAGPAIAAVLLNTAPFFVAVIGRLALDERVTALRAFGLVIGFAGVLTIILAGNSSSGEDVVDRRGPDAARRDRLRLRRACSCATSSLTGEPFDVHRHHGRAVPLRRRPAAPVPVPLRRRRRQRLGLGRPVVVDRVHRDRRAGASPT